MSEYENGCPILEDEVIHDHELICARCGSVLIWILGLVCLVSAFPARAQLIPPVHEAKASRNVISDCYPVVEMCPFSLDTAVLISPYKPATGNNNTAIGVNALHSNTTGTYDTWPDTSGRLANLDAPPARNSERDDYRRHSTPDSRPSQTTSILPSEVPDWALKLAIITATVLNWRMK